MPGHPDDPTFAGMLEATVIVGLDRADEPVTTNHELAHLLLECADEKIARKLVTCGQLLYDNGTGIPTRICIEPWGTEHDHDNARSRPCSP